MSKYEDLTNKRFGRLTVLETIRNGKHYYCKCKCDCGNIITTRKDYLKSSVTISCGCYAKEKAKECNTKHGLYKHPLYRVFDGMKQRCNNPNHINFKNYGAKGIRVEFRDFKEFFDWSMDHGYEKGCQIHRLNSDGNYTPENCVWIKSENHNRIHTEEKQKAVLRLDPVTNEVLEEFKTYTEARNKYGFMVAYALNNQSLIRYGYKWKYKNEEENKNRIIPKNQKRLYSLFRLMNEYCYNKDNKFYKNYGALGIKVSDEFKDFDNFEQWALNNGYKNNLMLDRKDLNKDFSKENCIWITRSERAIIHATKIKKVAKIDPATNEIIEIFNTIKEAKSKTHSRIDRALKDPNKILAGYKWKYID